MDLLQKCNSGYYNTKVPYPKKEDFKDIHKCDKCEHIHHVFDKDGYHKAVNDYHKENNRMYELFKQDCFKYYGIENNPAREVIFSKAWEEGHSSGFSEVANCMSDIIDFVERCIKEVQG